MLRRTLLSLLALLSLVSTTWAGSSHHAIIHNTEGFSLHKDTWVMPGSIANEYNEDQSEVVFQISVKQQLGNTGFYAAYTQKSFWQAYNTKESSPFRETNYNPEIFYRVMPGNALAHFLGNGPIIGKLGADIGFEHESNGRSMPESRSWNRAYFTPFYLGDNLLLSLKFWCITPDSQKSSKDGVRDSDNPDIADFMGYGEFNAQYQFAHDQLLHLMVRGTPGRSKGAVSLTWSIPITRGGLFFMVRGFHGYGESLIDYNRSISRIGAGFMLSR
ncbi:MAG: phospholipase A [Desulfobacterales bacterium]|nr:phospholipase A [Desulfobacterales bacterium]